MCRYKLHFSQILKDLLPFVWIRISWGDAFDGGHFDIWIPDMEWGISLVGQSPADGPGVQIPEVNDPPVKQSLVISFRTRNSGTWIILTCLSPNAATPQVLS